MTEVLPCNCTSAALPFQSFSTASLKVTDLMGERGKPTNKFDDNFYYFREQDTIIWDEFMQDQCPRVLIHGKVMSGKTRLTYNFLKHSLPLINDLANWKIYIFNDNNIEQFIDYFNEEINDNINTHNVVIVIDDLFKCFSRANKKDFITALNNVCDQPFKLITTCTTAEYKHILEDTSKHSILSCDNLFNDVLINIEITPISNHQYTEITEYYGVTSPHKETIGELLGIPPQWRSYNDDEQDILTREVLQAIHTIGYINQWGIKIWNVTNYLNHKVNSDECASLFKYSKIIQFPDDIPININRQHLEIPLKILCDYGIIYPVDHFMLDSELLIAEDYREQVIQHLPFRMVKNNILDFFISNKRITQLITHPKASQEIRDQLYRNRILEQDNLSLVEHSYCATSQMTFNEVLNFYTHHGEIQVDLVTLSILATKCQTIEQAQIILEQTELQEEPYTDNDSPFGTINKVDILNQLLTKFKLYVLNKRHDNYKGRNTTIQKYYSYNETTHLNIIKQFNWQHSAYTYYKDKNLKGIKEIILYLTEIYSWDPGHSWHLLKSFISNSDLPASQKKEAANQILNNLLTRTNTKHSDLYKRSKKYLNAYTNSLNVCLNHIISPEQLLSELVNDRKLYNPILLNTCIRRSISYEEAKIFFRKIPTPDLRSFHLLIEKIEENEHFFEVLDLIGNYNLYYDPVLISMINKRANMGFSALEIYHSIFESKRAGFNLTNNTLNTLINRAQSFKEVVKLISKANNSGLKFNLDLYCNLIQKESNFIDDIKSVFSDDQIAQHISERLSRCKQFTLTSNFYSSILYSDMFTAYHFQFFNEYIDAIYNRELEPDESVFLNYVSDTNGFIHILKKLSRIKHLLHKLSNNFFEQTNIISSYADIAAITELFEQHNRTFSGKLLNRIMLFKKNDQESFDIMTELLELVDKHLLNSRGLNQVLLNRQLISENEKQQVYKQVIEHFSYTESKVKPIPEIYIYMITNSMNHNEARKVYDMFKSSGLPRSFDVYINYLKKIDDIKLLKRKFKPYNRLFWARKTRIITYDEISSLFNHWYQLIEKLDDQNLAEIEFNTLKKYEFLHGFYRNSIHFSTMLDREESTVEEMIMYIQKYEKRKIQTYNMLFNRCKNVNDATLVYKSILADEKVKIIPSTIQQYFETVNALDQEQNYFDYLHDIIRAVESLPSCALKKDAKHTFYILSQWLQQCTSFDQFYSIVEYYPEKKVNSVKLPWKQKWYYRVIEDINSVDEAIFVFEHLGDWRSSIQVQLLEDRLPDLPSKWEFNAYIAAKYPEATTPWIYDITTVHQLRDVVAEYPHWEISFRYKSNCDSQPWYYNIIESIENLDDAIFVFEHFGPSKRYRQVLDVVQKLESSAEREEFFKHFEAFLKQIHFKEEVIEGVIYQGI
ncbi:hypothetical protein EYV94_00850 [Puteibacter caeruleilacunae]|nr:hypothetical protein EYV94_00850 [Puteibacter caeruleilacunae]